MRIEGTNAGAQSAKQTQNAQQAAFNLEKHRGAVCGCLLVRQYIIIDCR